MEFGRIVITGACARALWCHDIPTGTVGGTIVVDYQHPAWEALDITAVFRGCVTRDVLHAGTEIRIPPEVVEQPGGSLRVGFYGVHPVTGAVTPTFWAELGRVRPGTDPSGDPSTEPSLPVWAQLAAMIGDLANLDTEAKDTLVAAINEALTKGGGAADPEEIQTIIEEYLAANPPKVTESDPTVPAWAKQPSKPSYTAAEVGALPEDTVIPVVPESLKNPYGLTFTGAVAAAYDGSGAVSVEIPDAYSKTEIDAIMGAYIHDIDALVGGDG